MKSRWGEEGLTLVEVAVTVAIVGILAMIAIPSFISIMPRIRLNNSTQTLANEIAMSRMAAIAKSTDYQVVFDPVGERYNIRQFVSGTWLQNATTNIASFADLEGVKYLSDDSTAPNTLQLNATGTTNVPLSKEAVYITLQTQDGIVKRRVVVWMTGRIATEKWIGGTSWTTY